MRNTNIFMASILTKEYKRVMRISHLKNLIIQAACSICIAGMLLISKRDVISIVDWITGIGSDAIFLMLCLIISSAPTIVYLSQDNSGFENTKQTKDIIIELRSFMSGFAVFMIGVLIATGIQKLRLSVDVHPFYKEQLLSYSTYLDTDQYLLFYVLVASQMAMASGIISLFSCVIYKITRNISSALVLPVLIFKLEDMFVQSMFGLNSKMYYNSSLFMLSFGTLRFQLNNRIHYVRLVLSIGIIIICLLLSYLYRTLNSINKRGYQTIKILNGLLIFSLLIILLIAVLKGIIQFTRDTNESLSFYFISHLFDNIHFLTFWSLLFFLIRFRDSNSRCHHIMSLLIRNFAEVSTIYLSTIVLFIFIMIPNISFNNSWGNIIHTLSYNMPAQTYEFIATSNPNIERSFGPLEALIKSFLLVILVFVMLSLLYETINVLTNNIVAIIVTLLPLQLISAEELFFRYPWLYYISPLSWTRISLNSEPNAGISYPSFIAKVIALILFIFVLTVVLFALNKKNRMQHRSLTGDALCQ